MDPSLIQIISEHRRRIGKHGRRLQPCTKSRAASVDTLGAVFQPTGPRDAGRRAPPVANSHDHPPSAVRATGTGRSWPRFPPLGRPPDHEEAGEKPLTLWTAASGAPLQPTDQARLKLTHQLRRRAHRRADSRRCGCLLVRPPPHLPHSLIPRPPAERSFQTRPTRAWHHQGQSSKIDFSMRLGEQRPSLTPPTGSNPDAGGRAPRQSASS